MQVMQWYLAARLMTQSHQTKIQEMKSLVGVHALNYSIFKLDFVALSNPITRKKNDNSSEQWKKLGLGKMYDYPITEQDL